MVIGLLISMMLIFGNNFPVIHFTKVDSSKSSNSIVTLILSDLLNSPSHNRTILGNPRIIECPYGNAVLFDGQDDAIVMDTNYLIGMNTFTIEIIMRPDSDGQREQRFLHLGEVRGDRVLVETRTSNNTDWYLDAFIKSQENKFTLVDSTKLHPLNQWYSIAFIVDRGSMETYVDGKFELSANIPFIPFSRGETSIGVRLNRLNWFKGAIYKISIVPWKVDSNQLRNYEIR